MKLEASEIENGIRLIKLIGRLDLEGTRSVEAQFTQQYAREKVLVLVDLSQVNYLSSIGIHMLVSGIKAVGKQGGKLALLNPQVHVKSVLDIAGISNMVKIYRDLETAKARLLI